MGVSTIKMPQLGESVTEGTVDRWLKKEGDYVKKDEPLVEVVTDKVNAEIPSPFEGKLIKISVGEGSTIAIGTEIAQIEVDGAGTMDDVAAAQETPPVAAAPAASSPVAAPAAAAPVEAPPDGAARRPIQPGRTPPGRGERRRPGDGRRQRGGWSRHPGRHPRPRQAAEVG